MSIQLSLIAFTLLYIQLFANIGILARPDTLGLFLFLCSIIIPWKWNFTYSSLLAGILLSTLAFLTKPYFIFGAPCIALYLFLSKSKLKGIISEQTENKKSVTILNSGEYNKPSIDKILDKQVDIRGKTIEIISSIDELHPVYKYKDRLDYTSAVLMVKAIKVLDSAKNSASTAEFKLYLHETELTQEEIILVLKGILYRIEQLSQNQESE